MGCSRRVALHDARSRPLADLEGAVGPATDVAGLDSVGGWVRVAGERGREEDGGEGMEVHGGSVRARGNAQNRKCKE